VSETSELQVPLFEEPKMHTSTSRKEAKEGPKDSTIEQVILSNKESIVPASRVRSTMVQRVSVCQLRSKSVPCAKDTTNREACKYWKLRRIVRVGTRTSEARKMTSRDGGARSEWQVLNDRKASRQSSGWNWRRSSCVSRLSSKTDAKGHKQHRLRVVFMRRTKSFWVEGPARSRYRKAKTT
jgi:hypothetical protein